MTRDALEVWAGFECTLNRVGDSQHDQLATCGHYDRADDIERVASLGVRAIRYPVLWERLEDRSDDDARWRWIDDRLARLQQLGVQPIVGLMHHGSGPLDTSLMDDAFPARFAAFAGRVAERYPWVTHYTPVNEPLTTARFAALYGIWYPHARDDRAFARALLNQTRATRLAMEAIRARVPTARLVQTEDLGFTHATPALAHQAWFENERRWLSFDLLCGRVNTAHPMWPYLRDAGVTLNELSDAVGDGCAPDIIGVNHYVTSERWLDGDIEQYPPHTHGGNGRERYADVEAVRAVPSRVMGPARLLKQAWDRYGIPLAVTEVHLGCTREQQMRWLNDVWHAAHDACDAGADVRAVTVWAALGTYDWCSLVTRTDGKYESGLFDSRSSPPRRTALATMTEALACRGEYDHPAIHGPRWWRGPMRVRFESSHLGRIRPVVIAGARGTLGTAITKACRGRGIACLPLGRDALDITDEASVARVLQASGAWAVVNAAGWVRVDDAEQSRDECRRLNVDGAASLARACAGRGVRLATFSSDLVFDGSGTTPYVESDITAPLGEYGRSKRDAECAVLAAAPDALVVRGAWFFGPWDEWNFVTRALRGVARGAPFELPNDLVVSPTFVPHLADATLDLLIDGERGIWHLVNKGEGATAAEFARAAAQLAGLDASLVVGRPHHALGLTAKRPPFAALASARGTVMPTLDEALAEYVESRAWLADHPASIASPMSSAALVTA